MITYNQVKSINKDTMKKQYIAPEVELLKVNSSEIICTSVGFGDGNTSIMHSRQRDFSFDDEEEGMWDE